MIKVDHLFVRLTFGLVGLIIGIFALPVIIVTLPLLIGWVLCQEWDAPIRPDDRDIIIDDGDCVCSWGVRSIPWLR